jgi:acetylornithine/N-succinyldiaminopimelate aminotransferase
MIRDGLDSIGRRYGVFEPSRGLGLLVGAPMSAAWKGRAKEIVNAGLKHGVWTLVAGPDVLRMAPSLVIPEADIAEGLKRLEAGIAELTPQVAAA